MSAADAEDIAFASSAQLLFNMANTIDSIARNPPEWSGHCDSARNPFAASCGLVAKPASGGTYAAFRRAWIVGPFLRERHGGTTYYFCG